MTTLNMNPKNLIILGAIGIAAYWFTMRKASAAPVNAAQPGQPRPNASYGIAQGERNPTRYPVAGELGSTIGALGQLWNSITSPAIVRSPGYQPTYTPDSSGEAAARQYYVDNKDTFAVNPPDQYTTYTDSYEGIDSR